MPTATGIAGPGCAAALGTTIAPTATMHDNTAASQRRCTGGPPPTLLVRHRSRDAGSGTPPCGRRQSVASASAPCASNPLGWVTQRIDVRLTTHPDDPATE